MSIKYIDSTFKIDLLFTCIIISLHRLCLMAQFILAHPLFCSACTHDAPFLLLPPFMEEVFQSFILLNMQLQRQ